MLASCPNFFRYYDDSVQEEIKSLFSTYISSDVNPTGREGVLLLWGTRKCQMKYESTPAITAAQLFREMLCGSMSTY